MKEQTSIDSKIEKNNTNKSESSKYKTKDEFKIQYFDDHLEDDFEKMFEKEIEENCSLNIYVDKLEIKEIPDNKLILLEKQEIIDHKNYQIQKLKAFIASLEKEKEDLILNFRNTTNALLEKIKQNELIEYGIRPQTAKIVEEMINKDLNKLNIQNLNNNNPEFSIEKKNINVFSFEENKEFNLERCANCKKEFHKEKMMLHSLDCLRNKLPCKFCKELIPDKIHQRHISDWKSNQRLIESLKSNDDIMFKNCLDHGANPNEILDKESESYVIHFIAKYSNFKCLEVFLGKDVDLDVVNKNGETALFVSMKEKKIAIAKSLIELGIEINNKNSEDLTPLMLSCKMGLIEITELLLTHNANLFEANILGDTPLKLAQRFGHEELVLLLIQKYKALNRPQSKKGDYIGNNNN